MTPHDPLSGGTARQGVIAGAISLPVYVLISWLIAGDAPLLAHLFRAGLAAVVTGLGVSTFGWIGGSSRSSSGDDPASSGEREDRGESSGD
jgi:hypothetical protein